MFFAKTPYFVVCVSLQEYTCQWGVVNSYCSLYVHVTIFFEDEKEPTCMVD